MNEKTTETFTPTPSQGVALKKIESFMAQKIDYKNVNSRVMVIIGPAGSGKTTIVKYGLKKYIDADKHLNRNASSYDLFSNPNVLGVAVAHQAKKNLRKSIHICKTFASFFGLKEQHDEDGVRSFVKDENMIRYSLCKSALKAVVFDEVSMFDLDMVNLVLKETNPNMKIIFMGDDAQLPPINSVGDEDSPVFTMFKNIVELTEVVRQEESNPILQLATLIRKEIKGNQDLKLVLKAMMKDNLADNKGHRVIPYRNFLTDFKNITTNHMEAKVIAYRRQTVSNYNIEIRNFIYYQESKIFIPGEILYMNDTYYHDEDQVKIETVQQMEYQAGKTSDTYYCHNSTEYRIKEVRYGEKIQGVAVYKIYIEIDEDNDDFEGIENPFLPVIANEGIAEYKRIFFHRERQAKQPGLDKNARKSKWKWFYSFKNAFASVSYGYSLTNHKAQGSGYKYIYIDINDILTVGPISTKRKLQAIYTAVTRATDLVTFLKQNKSNGH